MSRRPLGLAPVLLAVACAALLLAQHVAARAVRDALFLSSFGSGKLPMAMLAAAAAGLLAVLGTARLMAMFGPGRVVPAFLLGSGLAHVLEWTLLERHEHAAVVLVYLHVSMAGGIAVSGFWSVVNERFDPHAVRALATRLTAGLAVGGLLGGIAARNLGIAYGLRPMLLVFAGGSALASLGLYRLARGSSALEFTLAEPPQPRGVKSSKRYLGAMATLVALMGLSSAVVDFAFKASVSAHVPGERLVAFFALFYMVVSVASVILQLTLARWMLAHFGIGVGLASLPVVVAGLGLVSILLPVPGVLTILRGSSVAIESSLFRAAYEPLYAPLPLAEKRAKKSLIDVACDRLGEGLGSVVVLFLTGLAPAVASRFGVGVGVVAALGATFVAARLERGYVGELAASLRSGRVRLADGEVTDATTRLTLSQTQLELDRDALVRQIEELRRGGRPPERSTPGRELMAALADGDAARINAALLAGPVEVELSSLVIACLAHDETAEAAVVALRSVAGRIPGQLVDALLDEGQPLRLRRRIPRVLRTVTSPRAVRGLAEALTDKEPDIRGRAALALRDVIRANSALRPPRRVVLEAAARELERGHENTFDQVFTLLGLVLDADALDLSLRALGSDEEKLRGTALEYLEHVIPEPIRSGIWPYLQAGRRPRQAQARRPADIAEELRRSMA